MDEPKFSTWDEYVAANRETVERDFPGPQAMIARMLVSGWRSVCARTGRDASFPAEDREDRDGTAADWRARAADEARRAKAHGGQGSVFAEDDLAKAYLALHGRGPTGHRFAGGAR